MIYVISASTSEVQSHGLIQLVAKAQERQPRRKIQWINCRKTGKHLENFSQNSLYFTTSAFPSNAFSDRNIYSLLDDGTVFVPVVLYATWTAIYLFSYLLPFEDYELLEKRGYVSFIFLSLARIILTCSRCMINICALYN